MIKKQKKELKKENKYEYANRKRRNNKRNFRVLKEDIIRTCREYSLEGCKECPMQDESSCLIREIRESLIEDNIDEIDSLKRNIDYLIKRVEFKIISSDDRETISILNTNLIKLNSIRTSLNEYKRINIPEYLIKRKK